MTEFPLPPGATIGILGGGQLGRMLSLAAARLGLKCHIYSDRDVSPAFDVAAAATCGAYDDAGKLRAFAKACDAVTCEFENVPAETVAIISETTPVAPGARALEVAQDRLIEKRFVQDLGVAVAPFQTVDSADDLAKAIEEIGRPALLKTRRFGYDGKGQVKIEADTDVAEAAASLKGAPAILEGFVAFEREISVVAVRARDGATVFYDPAENAHENQILKVSTVPAHISDETADSARAIAGKIADALDYVGVMCVEMFQCAGGALVVNEIAPRVHNSGHWTIDGCTVSQFENHIRAVAGWPLGSTRRHANAQMTNLLGDEVDQWQELAREEAAGVHIYGKSPAKPGRKMGHVTRLTPRNARSER